MNKAEQTKTHILNTAFRLFLQKSYREVTMQELQENAQVSRGGLYHHFKNKEEIFLATAHKFFFSMMDESLDMGVMAEQPFMENFQSYLVHKQQVMDKMLTHTELEDLDANYFMLVFQTIQYFPETREELKKQVVQETKNWANIIKIAQNKGEIKQHLDAEALARHIYYLLDGVEMHLVMMGNINSEMHNRITTMIEQLYELIRW
ncbi:TetR/AcrR family transcriptional regulator [Microscilla marina]|uniref:Transcriptional regulator, TetR family protein n=1 Tax=Microscilla marina ATCC 23134 TaxID=313606 RepID=A1ZL86_MICM2|nr:TetR/AcrR family transcriptional regulator [Microscilla marina]EAY29052.1 transcriptional regulator, TetR family protein [Microscilla marina ATCC 23134]